MGSTAAMMVGDNDARMNDVESESVREPLARVLQRMSPTAVARYQALTDPVTLISALGFWGLRVYAEYQNKKATIITNDNANVQQNAANGAPSSFDVRPPIQGNFGGIPSDPG